jgi:Zn-finger nucleic acid-binding protein
MEDERNRVQGKPKFVERAGEDIYFAAKDRELIDEMKADWQGVEAAKRKAQRLCAKCPGKFESYSLMGLVLDRCERCEGIWLNKGELEEISRKAARGPLQNFLQSLSPRTKQQ